MRERGGRKIKQYNAPAAGDGFDENEKKKEKGVSY
jgi:hypothetical protein